MADFIREEIAAGFAALAALNLKGRPAAKDLTATAEVWARTLYARPVRWDERQDRTRLRTGFLQLLQHCREWPVPRDLVEALPLRREPRELPPPPMTEAERQENLARMNKALKPLFDKMNRSKA